MISVVKTFSALSNESIVACLRIPVCEQERPSMMEQIRGETSCYEILGNSERH